MTDQKAVYVEPGLYVHYKGGVCYVRGIAVDRDENRGTIVIYDPPNCGNLPSYRPISEFVEIVDTRNGTKHEKYTDDYSIYLLPRFQKIVGWTVGGNPLVEGVHGGGRMPFSTHYQAPPLVSRTVKK